MFYERQNSLIREFKFSYKTILKKYAVNFKKVRSKFEKAYNCKLFSYELNFSRLRNVEVIEGPSSDSRKAGSPNLLIGDT